MLLLAQFELQAFHLAALLGVHGIERALEVFRANQGQTSDVQCFSTEV